MYSQEKKSNYGLNFSIFLGSALMAMMMCALVARAYQQQYASPTEISSVASSCPQAKEELLKKKKNEPILNSDLAYAAERCAPVKHSSTERLIQMQRQAILQPMD